MGGGRFCCRDGARRFLSTLSQTWRGAEPIKSNRSPKVRAFGPCDLFVTMSEFWQEVQELAAEFQPGSFEMFSQPAATSRAYNAKMKRVMVELEEIYGPLRGVSWSNEFQHRGRRGEGLGVAVTGGRVGEKCGERRGAKERRAAMDCPGSFSWTVVVGVLSRGPHTTEHGSPVSYRENDSARANIPQAYPIDICSSGWRRR